MFEGIGMGFVCLLLGAGVSVFGGYLASKVDNRFEEFLALFSGICGGSLIMQMGIDILLTGK